MDDEPVPDSPDELARELRRRAGRPPSHPADAGEWDYVLRFDSKTLQRVVRPAVCLLLHDADPEIRRLALHVIGSIPDSGATLTDLLNVARDHIDLFDDRVIDGFTLRNHFIHGLVNAAAGSGRDRDVVPLLRQLLPTSPSEEAAGLIACVDPDFAVQLVRDHAQEGAFEESCTRIVQRCAVFQRDHLLDVLRLLTHWPVARREELLATIADDLSIDAGRIAAIAKRAKIDPPRLPPPSLDDCRRAIGLA